MRPYHIQVRGPSHNVISAWIDLDHVQMIYDVSMSDSMLWPSIGPGFAIILAFQDHAECIELHGLNALNKEEADQLIAGLVDAHDKLLAAWKSK